MERCGSRAQGGPQTMFFFFKKNSVFGFCYGLQLSKEIYCIYIYCVNRGHIRPWDLKGSIRDVVYGLCCGKFLFLHGSKRKRKYPLPSPKLVFILSKREYGTHRLFPKGCLGEFACRARIKRRKDIPPPPLPPLSHHT